MKKRYLYILAMVWLLILGAGFALLLKFAYTPGTRSMPLAQWPENISLQQDPHYPTLVLFAHPNCSCSKATMGELNEIVAKVAQKIRIYVLFVTPENPESNWKESSLWDDAKNVAGAQVMTDEGGAMATLFGAKTSGQVNLYDQKGQLVFSGGITASRGHFGDNKGKSAIITFINEKKVLLSTTPVFGCSLVEGHHT